MALRVASHWAQCFSRNFMDKWNVYRCRVQRLYILYSTILLGLRNCSRCDASKWATVRVSAEPEPDPDPDPCP